MPSYNSEKYISESIESVRSQTYSNWELLITDDCSSDNTTNVVESFISNDKRIKLFALSSNSGAGVARNNSIKIASGRFIAFLDSDDLWDVNKLKNQISFMLDNNYEFTFTAYQKFTDNQLLGVVSPPSTTEYNRLLYSNVIGCLTAVYDTNRIGKIYMPLIRKRQDMGLWLNILKLVPKAYCLNQTLAKYRIDSGMTSNKFSVLSYQWELYRKVLGFGVLRSASIFVVYAFRGFLKSKV
jgi:glycosyltransferase involved in cell wall biosynthesis